MVINLYKHCADSDESGWKCIELHMTMDIVVFQEAVCTSFACVTQTLVTFTAIPCCLLALTEKTPACFYFFRKVANSDAPGSRNVIARSHSRVVIANELFGQLHTIVKV